MKKRRERLKPEVRKAQIINVTRELILEKGLSYATVSRISEVLNISHTTLYYHFKNRREILLETFKAVMEEIAQPLNLDTDDVYDFIHISATAFFEQSRKNPKLGRLFLELLCAPPEEIIYDEAQIQLSSLHNIYVSLIQKGIDQGIFREDTDVMLAGWQLMSFLLATFLGGMLELPNFISLEQGLRSVDLILDSLKPNEKL